MSASGKNRNKNTDTFLKKPQKNGDKNMTSKVKTRTLSEYRFFVMFPSTDQNPLFFFACTNNEKEIRKNNQNFAKLLDISYQGEYTCCSLKNA